MGEEEQDTDVSFVETYGQDLLPTCACFAVGADGDISAAGREQAALMSSMAIGVTHTMIEAGVCPQAVPQMLAILVSAVMMDVTFQRRDVDTPTDALPHLHRTNAELIRLLPLHASRVDRIVLEMMARGQETGTC